jgi:hypothetical protein
VDRVLREIAEEVQDVNFREQLGQVIMMNEKIQAIMKKKIRVIMSKKI